MEIKNTKLQDYIKIFDLVLNEDILNNFLEICKAHNFENAKIIGSSEGGPFVNKKIRKTDVWALMNQARSLTTVHWFNLLNFCFTQKYYQYVVENFKNPIIEQPIPKIIDIQVLRYKEDFFYKYHIDQCPQTNRQWSSIFFVNDNYEGGDLVISTADGGVQHKIEKKKNRLVIWPSNFMYPHTVLPVTKGIRYSVVSWAQ